MTKKKFDTIAAATKTGRPTMEQLKMNGGFKTEGHEYDSKRPVRPVVSRYGK